MSYIGSTPTSQNFIAGTDYFSGTGSQTAFTLTRTVNSVNDIEVTINNVPQQPSTAYTLSGTTITFTSAPSSGTNNIYVRYLATNMQSFTVPANSINRSKLDADLQAVAVGRNRIINGAMVVDQRNAGASIVGGNNFGVDRFQTIVSQSSKYNVQQNAGSVTPPAGFTNYLGITSTSSYSVTSTDYFAIRQFIEGYNIADLGWGTANAKTVTLSFWVYSSLTGTFGGTLQNSAQTRAYPYSYTISSVNTWEYKTVTITGETTGTWLTTNGQGIGVYFSLGTGSSNMGTANAWSSSSALAPSGSVNLVGTSGATFYITGVQLEEGTTATSFEREAYSVTLQKCYRYCWVLSGNGLYYPRQHVDAISSTTGIWYVQYPAAFRTTPSLTTKSISSSTIEMSNHSNGNGPVLTSVTFGESAYQSGFVNMIAGSGWVAGSTGHWRWIGGPDANFTFSAEL